MELEVWKRLCSKERRTEEDDRCRGLLKEFTFKKELASRVLYLGYSRRIYYYAVLE